VIVIVNWVVVVIVIVNWVVVVIVIVNRLVGVIVIVNRVVVVMVVVNWVVVVIVIVNWVVVVIVIVNLVVGVIVIVNWLVVVIMLTGAVGLGGQQHGVEDLVFVLLVQHPALPQVRRQLPRGDGPRQLVAFTLHLLPQGVRVHHLLGPASAPALGPALRRASSSTHSVLHPLVLGRMATT
jgi:hypothetical protein